MNLGYTILDPKHKQYWTGTLFFEYETENFFTLKRIGFVIDNQTFFMNMILSKTLAITTTWIFQKENSIKPISAQEREKLLALTEDVLENFELKKSMLKILGAIRPQTEIYLKLLNKDLPLNEKKALKKEFRDRNKLIALHNTAHAQTAKRKQQKLIDKEHSL